MKRVYQYEKDFFEECKVYDLKLKDIFGNKFYILHNELLNEIRFISKNNDYNKKRKYLNKKKLNNIIISKYSNIIDLDENTYNNIRTIFKNVRIPDKKMLNIY